MDYDHFIHPRSVCRWAREEIDKFNAEAQAFVDDCDPVLFHQRDTASFDIIHGYEVSKAIPDILWKRSHHIVSDLRNALDQAVHAASLTLRTKKPHKTNFPVAESADGVRRRLETNPLCAGVPEALHPKICSFEPFWEECEGGNGNTILRTIIEIANPNKHRVPIRVGVDPVGVQIRGMTDIKRFNVRPFSKNKIELFRSEPWAKPKLNADIQIGITMAEGRWSGGKLAGVVFKLMCDEVEEVVEGLAEETADIVAAENA